MIHLASIHPSVVIVFVFLFGLVFGSFLNVCIYRIPRRRSVVAPASACPSCGMAIRPYDNIPVVSWLILGGRCRSCRAWISPRYIAVELLTGLLFVACYLHAGSVAEFLKLCVFSFLVVGLIFIDAEHRLLPDKLTLTGLCIGLAFSFLVPVGGLDVPSGHWLGGHPVPPQLIWFLNSAIGAVFGAFFIYGAGEIYFRMRGVQGMGFGDVKLMGMVGAYLGMKLTLLTILVASFAGTLYGLVLILSVWRKRLLRRLRAKNQQPNAYARSWQSAQMILRRYEVPFGVFLGGMALISALAGEQIIRSYIRWYISLFR